MPHTHQQTSQHQESLLGGDNRGSECVSVAAVSQIKSMTMLTLACTARVHSLILLLYSCSRQSPAEVCTHLLHPHTQTQTRTHLRDFCCAKRRKADRKQTAHARAPLSCMYTSINNSAHRSSLIMVDNYGAPVYAHKALCRVILL